MVPGQPSLPREVYPTSFLKWSNLKTYLKTLTGFELPARISALDLFVHKLGQFSFIVGLV